MTLHVIAIEFGGQSIKAGIVDLQGNVVSYHRMMLSQENPIDFDNFSADFGELIQKAKREIDLVGVGIAHPNPFNSETFTFQLAHKPSYRHINGHSLQSLIGHYTGIPEGQTIYDAGAAGLGELWQGAIEEQGRFMLLTLGTGLGAVFMQDGLIVTGQHVPDIPKTGELWDLQYRNTHFENSTGTTKAAVSIYHSFGGTDPMVLAGDLKRLAEMARQNEDGGIAQKTFAEFGSRLGDGLVSTVNTFRPKSIILSGNIALAYDLFETEVRGMLIEKMESPYFEPQIVQSKLIDRGGLLGAAFCAFYPQRHFRL